MSLQSPVSIISDAELEKKPQKKNKPYIYKQLQTGKMTLSITLSRGLSFRRSRDAQTTPASSTFSRESGFSLGEGEPVQLISQSKPVLKSIRRKSFASKFTLRTTSASPITKLLTPEQVRDLNYFLSLPIDFALLTTHIACLPRPLSREPSTATPRCLCDVHSWFNPCILKELMTLIGDELHTHLDRLRELPRGVVSEESEKVISTLSFYLPYFPASGVEDARNSTYCIACTLSGLLRDREAMDALNSAVKGRKKKGSPWPELAAYLDPLPGPGWLVRWKKQGQFVLQDRKKGRIFRKVCTESELRQFVEKMNGDTTEEAADRERAVVSLDMAVQQEKMLEKDEVLAQMEREERRSPEMSRQGRYISSSDLVNDKGQVGKKEAWMSAYTVLTGSPDRDQVPSHDSDEISHMSKTEAWTDAYTALMGVRPDNQTTLAFEHHDDDDAPYTYGMTDEEWADLWIE